MQKIAWKIGELAKQTGITVRTLHHYHHIGLLSPSEFTESGHRLYSKNDISRLQQIISLKQLGFSLDEIKAFIDKPNYDPLQVIRIQLERVKEQIKAQEQLCWELEHIYKLLAGDQEIGAERFIKLIEVIHMNGQSYLTPEQMEKMKKLQGSLTTEERNRMESAWAQFISRLKENYEKGTPVGDPEVVELAKRWRSLTAAFAGSDPEVIKAGERFHTENPGNPIQFGMTEELYRYLQTAMAKL